MEIFPNVHEIKSLFGDRYIQQYLFVGETVVLLDAGIISTPESTIFPYMEEIGIAPQRLSLVIALHADGDHHGGLPAIKDASRTTQLACHAGDRSLIENPERLYQDRYNFLSHDHELGFGREGMVYSPRPCQIDVSLSADEIIKLSPDWSLKVWHVPGHSDGHLAIYDEKNRAAFTSDAVQSAGYPTTAGAMAFAPTYYAVDAYLASIEFLEQQPIEHMLTGHWPAMRRKEEAKNFLRSSREFVERVDSGIIGFLGQHHAGVTLKRLIGEIGPKLGAWPEDANAFLQFALYGHLERLKQRGMVRSGKSIPVEYSLV
jgi:glyoxylase-like metal-dependent hydrolase (beta-lactamase superfamily II)